MKPSRKKNLLFQVVSLASVLFGCSQHLVTIPLVSMTKSESPAKTKSIGAVKQQYCDNEYPIVPPPDIDPTLIDEVIIRAQKASKADYLRNASLTHSPWEKCIEIEAEGLIVQ